jgi:toxin ParE1/3/4
VNLQRVSARVHKIVQTLAAETDLVEIWLYTAQEWSYSQADIYLDELVSGIGNLASHPELGYSRDDIRKEYRSINVNHHIVFYKIVDAEIHVTRILHESVDVPRHL